MDLRNRTVLVTGASAGLGLATARHFAESGARVIAAARRLEPMEEVARSYGDRMKALKMDVRDRKNVTDAIAGLPEAWKAIDTLVNNAGLRAGTQTFQESDPNDWDVMVDTNIRGLLNVTNAVLPRMIAAGRGHVINIGSNGVRFPYKTGAVYSGSKAAIESISTGMRLDLNGTGVRTTHINLGLTKTDISLVRFGGDRAKIEAHYAGRAALDPNEVAKCILWLVSLPEQVEVADIRIYPTGQVTAS